MPVTRIEIKERGPLAGGQSFGETGPYEYLTGIMHFTADPEHPGHAVICDLDAVPPNADGLVEYRSEFHLLKPVSPPPGGRLLVDAINRGNWTALSMFNGSARRTDGDPDVDPGDGFLMREGYSVLAIGIQCDPPQSPERMRAWFPEALQDGKPITGPAFVQWWQNRVTPHQLLSDAGHTPYPTADVDDQQAVLTVRDHQDGPPMVIPRNQWRFAEVVDGQVVSSAGHAYLETGFQPGKVYELTYTAVGAPVVGLGFLAYRDAASFLKHASAAEGNPLSGALDYAYAWGQSMSGRWVRELLYWGLNKDEAGRVVFEGMLPHLGSSRRGEFNVRFGQPSTNILRAPGNIYPFAFEATPEPVTGEHRGLLDRTRANASMPKVIHVNSGMEYWWSGAALGHTTVDGTKDFDPPPEVRVYYMSGTQHGSGALPLRDKTPDGFQAQQPINTLDYRPLIRALLTALDRWVRDGDEPPPSRVPRVADGTAVTRESLETTWTRIPGAAWLSHLPQRLRLDYGPDPDRGTLKYPPEESGAYPMLVSSMDDDGNDVAGIRLPDVAVPLATYSGWNVRDALMGSPGLMTSGSPLFGATLVLPRTKADREASGDPRSAIEERYASKDDYLGKVRAAAQELVDQRYLLAEDLDECVGIASAKWDAFHG